MRYDHVRNTTLALLVFSAPLVAQAQDNATVTGVVVDGVTEQPIPGVLVSVEALDRDELRQVPTDVLDFLRSRAQRASHPGLHQPVHGAGGSHPADAHPPVDVAGAGIGARGRRP